MKIKLLSAIILSFALAQNSVAAPIWHKLGEVGTTFVQNSHEYGKVHSPDYHYLQSHKLFLAAEDLASEGKYADAIQKVNQAIDYNRKQKVGEDTLATQDDLDMDFLRFHERNVRYLLLNHQIDDAKQAARQVHELAKEKVLANETIAQYFYNLGHSININAYTFADDADETEFAKERRAAIQSTFDAIFAKYPDLEDYFAYNNACLAAQRGETQRTIQLLNVAIKQRDYSRQDIDEDRDFDAIREQPEFQKWLNTTFAPQKTARKKKK